RSTATGETTRDSRAHSQPIPAPASATSAGRNGEPSHTAAKATGTITRDDRIRSASPLVAGRRVMGSTAAGSTSARAGRGAVAALAAVEIADRLLEIGAAEIRP